MWDLPKTNYETKQNKKRKIKKRKKNLLLVLKRDGSRMYPFCFSTGRLTLIHPYHSLHDICLRFDLSRLDTYGMEHLAMDWDEGLLPTWRKYMCGHDPTRRTKQPGLSTYHQHSGSESFWGSQNKQILGFLESSGFWVSRKWIISK